MSLDTKFNALLRKAKQEIKDSVDKYKTSDLDTELTNVNKTINLYSLKKVELDIENAISALTSEEVVYNFPKREIVIERNTKYECINISIRIKDSFGVFRRIWEDFNKTPEIVYNDTELRIREYIFTDDKTAYNYISAAIISAQTIIELINKYVEEFNKEIQEYIPSLILTRIQKRDELIRLKEENQRRADGWKKYIPE